MSAAIDELATELRPHYSEFLSHRKGEVLMTAHSHQAWPNAAREGQLAAWQDAARFVDGKWTRVFEEVLPELQERVGHRLGTSRSLDLAFASNTHELVYRLLSCFPADARVLTTNQEFHSVARQLARSEESGLEVRRIPVEPGSGFELRFIDGIHQYHPDLIILSQVFFTDARVVSGISDILQAAAEETTPVLVDTYHSYCALVLDVDRWPGTVFVTGGGYKYAQCGEGTSFLLLPPSAETYRPRYTGWMADFGGLESGSKEVRYGPGGMRFFGATFDPTPYYRAVHVLRWMDDLDLSPQRLRSASVLRTERILELYDDHELVAKGLRLVSPRASEQRGAFVAFAHPRAQTLIRRLREQGIHTDARGELLRLGPAPYTTAEEIERAMSVVSQLV